MLPINNSSSIPASDRIAHSKDTASSHDISAVKAAVILKTVKSLVHDALIATLDDAKKIDAETQVLEFIFPSNLVMISALQATNRALQASNIHLSSHQAIPESIENLVREALTEAWDSPVLQANAMVHIPTESLILRLNDIEKLQVSIDASKTPLANIAREHRWRMCLDPLITDLVEKHISGARENPLLPFILDLDRSYLHGMLNGWDASMKRLHERFDAALIVKLHSACCNHNVPEEYEVYFGGVGLNLGGNMTFKGRQELLDFAHKQRAFMPGYLVTSSEENVINFNRRLAIAKPGEQIMPPEAPPADGAVLGHPEVSLETMCVHMDRFIDHYHTRMERGHGDESRLEHIVELCKNLEQLHPFPDGNARLFGVILLNHLLIRNAMPLTMLNDPNIFDGWSRSEIVEEVKSGWRRIAPYYASPSRFNAKPR